MTDQQNQQPAIPLTLLQQVVAHYHACRDADDDVALARAEAQLAEIMPGCLFDLFTALPLLADKGLSETTREKLLDNVIRSTKFIEIDFDNVVEWYRAREGGIAEFKTSFAAAHGRLTQAEQRLADGRSILSAITGDTVAECAGTVMEQTASDLQASKALLELADHQLNNPRLRELAAKNDAERQVFEAYLLAKRQ